MSRLVCPVGRIGSTDLAPAPVVGFSNRLMTLSVVWPIMVSLVSFRFRLERLHGRLRPAQRAPVVLPPRQAVVVVITDPASLDGMRPSVVDHGVSSFPSTCRWRGAGRWPATRRP